MDVEWGGNGWPVLKSAQDVAREEAERLAGESSAAEIRGASSSAPIDNREEEEDK